MKLINITKLIGISIIALVIAGCGGGSSGSNGGSTQSCSTELKYMDRTFGTGKYTGVRVYNNSSIIINNMTLGSSFQGRSR